MPEIEVAIVPIEHGVEECWTPSVKPHKLLEKSTARPAQGWVGPYKLPVRLEKDLTSTQSESASSDAQRRNPRHIRLHWISFPRFQADQVAFLLDSLGGSESTGPKLFDADRSQRLPDPSPLVPDFSPALPQLFFKKNAFNTCQRLQKNSDVGSI